MRRVTRTWLVVIAVALSFVLGVVGMDGPPRPARAQTVPQVVVTPDSAAPGDTVMLEGSGWPAGATLFARIYRASDVDGAGADLGMTFQADAAGNFSVYGLIPPTLFSGGGNRGNVQVAPDAYTIVVRAGPGLSASAPFSVPGPSGAGSGGCLRPTR